MSYLLILKGPNQGQRYPLDQPRTVIGRDRECDVMLATTDQAVRNPQAISRKHAIITHAEGKYYLEDGDGAGQPSRNKTYLNDAVVPFPQRVRLRNDDVIRICDFELIFHDSSPDSDTSSIDVAIEHDSSFLIAQPAKRLEILLGITNRMSHALELDRLLPDVAETLLQLFKQADRAFVILVDEASGGLVSRSRKSRQPEEEGQSGFSTCIVERCLKTMKGLLSNDVGEQFASSESAAGLHLRSVMCAPLWSQQGKAVGVLLLDSRNDRKQFTEDDLNLLMGVASQTSIALANARFHRDALIRQSVMQEAALAEKVVRSFLPAHVPEMPGYEFFAYYQPAQEVGGDYYDFIPLAGQRLGVLVGDVAGKGVPAALVMTRFSAEARACLRTEADLVAAIHQLNALMQPISLIDRFVTLAALLLDPGRHTLTVVNAGHPSPLLLRRVATAVEEIAPRATAGPALAVEQGCAYAARQIALQPGDSVVLFSDGVTDAMSLQGRQLGIKGLRAVIQRGSASPSELGQRILQTVQEHAAGCSQYDDITLVCFGRTT
jgi:serine phosphatase RsbU (regulator of sigma subunit)/pSer/pThr/pTyr-binding forkhead associated (FHA) protein